MEDGDDAMTAASNPMFVIAGDTWAMIAESFPDNTAPPRLAALVDLELVEDGGSNDVREEMISASVT
ncbi:MAG TPA: hypothetical protein VG983_09545, partial [Caulobacterales bacterium]|nr:hypothetical protein [Caulobacterales bacterium]